MEKRIKDFEDYAITDDGKVISYKYKEPRIMKTWYQASGYENIKLCKNNRTYHFLIHRLVAEAFIPNPNNYKEVNHIDKNPQNNKLENLEWCDRVYNLKQSYETLGPVRNYCNCKLIKEETGEVVKEFRSKIEAARYANENFGCSISFISKGNKVSKGYKILKCND